MNGVCTVCEYEPCLKETVEVSTNPLKLSFANTAQRTELSTSKQVWKQNGITLVNEKASSTNAVADYSNPARFYAGSNLTVTFEGMTKIVFNCNSTSYANSLKTSIGTVSNGTVSVSSKAVTVTFNTPVNEFVIQKFTAQVRIDSIDVYYQKTTTETVHTVKQLPAVDATCTTAGLTAGSLCEICGMVLVEQTVVEALGHTEGEPVSENENGDCFSGVTYDLVVYCVDCGIELSRETLTAEGAHTPKEAVLENETKADCENDGVYDSVVYCQVCEAELSRDTVVVEAFGHSYQSVVTEPTCTTAGYTTYTCSVCSDSYVEGEIEAFGHADEDEDYLCDNGCKTILEPDPDVALTIEQANKLGKAHETGKYSTNVYYITGIIDEVYNTQYGNMYIVDEDGNKFSIYGLYSADGKTGYSSMSYKPVKGDEITIFGNVGNYNGTAQIKDAKLDEVVAHEHDYSIVQTPPTCLAEGYNTRTCSICNVSYMEVYSDALGHTTENGTCERCGEEISGAPIVGQLAEFTFGDNGAASHADGSDMGSSKSFTAGSYTLSLTGASKVYNGARDAKGNSCLKLGASSAIGSFQFTVPDNVTEVVIYVAKYKSNTTKINVNGSAYTLTKNSNDGAYDVITIDTTTNKTVTFTTVSGGVRCMINTIVFNGYAK